MQFHIVEPFGCTEVIVSHIITRILHPAWRALAVSIFIHFLGRSSEGARANQKSGESHPPTSSELSTAHGVDKGALLIELGGSNSQIVLLSKFRQIEKAHG